MSFNPSALDGLLPRQHLVQFLPASSEVAPGSDVDLRTPADPSVMPYRVAHVCDERGENFVVQYATKQRCHDGKDRKSVWY